MRRNLQRFSIVSIPQAVWIACNVKSHCRMRYGPWSFNTASGMDCMQWVRTACCRTCSSAVSIPQAVWIACNHQATFLCIYVGRFNTASGMDCMQYRPSQPLGQLNPEAGFLNGALFLANRRDLAGFFCRQNRLKTSANPVISRKLLSTEKI